MNCSNCGREIRPDLKFCPGCGSPVRQKSPETQFKHPDKIQPDALPDSNTGKKPLSAKELPNWNPPQVSAPVERTSTNIPLQSISATLGKIKNTTSKLTGIIPASKIRLPGKLAIVLPATVAFAILLIAFLSLRSCAPSSSAGKPPKPFSPKGFKNLDAIITDVVYDTKIEAQVEIGNKTDKESIREALEDILEYWKRQRGFEYHRHPTTIAVKAYRSEDTYNSDPGWYIAQLYWTKGMDPKYEYNADAAMPRFRAMGHSGLERPEYIGQSENILKKLRKNAAEINKLLKNHEQMASDDKTFLEKTGPISKKIYNMTAKLPQPPWNDCIELNQYFEAAVKDAVELSGMLDPDERVAGDNRIDAKAIHTELTNFDIDFSNYTMERAKYK
jgi:hypothetical protein